MEDNPIAFGIGQSSADVTSSKCFYSNIEARFSKKHLRGICFFDIIGYRRGGAQVAFQSV